MLAFLTSFTRLVAYKRSPLLLALGLGILERKILLEALVLGLELIYILSLSISLLSVLGAFVHSIAYKHLPLHLSLAIEVLRDYFQSFGAGLSSRRQLVLPL